jgi:hypothetical protein
MNRFKVQYLLIILFPIAGAWLGSMLAGAERDPSGISFGHIALGAAMLCGVTAFFQRYLQSAWQYYAALILAIVFSAFSLIAAKAPISIFSLLLPNLLYAVLSIYLIRFVFYSKSFFRLRTLLMGVCGGIMLSLYLAGLYAMMGIELVEGFWNASFIYGLIIYVFIAFSMSIADLLILQSEVRELKKEETPEDDQ